MPWTRLLIAFSVAVLPPIAVLLVLVLGSWTIGTADRLIIAAVFAVGTLAWAASLAALYTRLLGSERRKLLKLAERGAEGGGRSSTATPDAADRLTVALATRERQLAVLADEIANAPVTSEPERVAHHVVHASRSVTGDGTWVLAVLTTSAPELLRAAVYDGGAEPEPAPLDDLHRWASVTMADEEPFPGRAIDGPWGRFMAVPAGSEGLRAVLLAPWEGRAEPGPADLALLRLIGRHAGTAIQHAVLYGTVHQQAVEIDRMASVQRDFLRGVSHDLQTPLTSIKALATELRAAEHLGPQGEADLDTIEHQADRLRRMVAQLLVVSRLEVGAIQPRQEIVSLEPLVARTWQALRAVDRALDLRVEGDPMLAIGDPDRVEQVLWAILENAVRYSPPGSTILVRIRPGTAAGTIAVAVTDTGTGMDQETLAHAFDQFYRAPLARDLAPDGSGIGLYAARGLVEAMGGAISLESRLGQGTTATVSLPGEPVNANDDPRDA